MTKPKGYWKNYDNCYNEALKYESRGEFSDKSPSAWKNAKNNGWIEDYTWFEKKVKYWTYERCYEEAKKYKTRKEFSIKKVALIIRH